MKPIVVTTTTLDNDADGICASQSAAGAAELSINGALTSGGVATIAEAQIVTITSAGNDTGITFTITGTDADGKAASEVVTGVNAAAADSTGHFKTVTSVLTSGATDSTVTVGVTASNGGVSKTVRINRNQVSSFKVGLYVELSSGASLTYSVEHSPTYPESGDFVNTSYSNAANWYTVDGLTTLTATDKGNIVIPAETVRLNLTAYTSGTTTFTIQQNY